MSSPSTFQHALAAVRRVNRQPADGSRRIAQLDGLRAVAVLMVIVFHLEIGVGIGGMFGVDLFLVLSGFLITGVLVGEYRARGTVSVRRFYERRILRLYPALVLMIVVLVPFGSLLNAEGSWGVWSQSVDGGADLHVDDRADLQHALRHGRARTDLDARGRGAVLSAVGADLRSRARPRRPAAAHGARRRCGAVALLSIFCGVSPVDPIGGIALYYRPPAVRAAARRRAGARAGVDIRTLTRRCGRAVSVGAVFVLVGMCRRGALPTLWRLDGNPLAAIRARGACATLIVARLATSNASILSRLAARSRRCRTSAKISYGLYLGTSR